ACGEWTHRKRRADPGIFVALVQSRAERDRFRAGPEQQMLAVVERQPVADHAPRASSDILCRFVQLDAIAGVRELHRGGAAGPAQVPATEPRASRWGPGCAPPGTLMVATPRAWRPTACAAASVRCAGRARGSRRARSPPAASGRSPPSRVPRAAHAGLAPEAR